MSGSSRSFARAERRLQTIGLSAASLLALALAQPALGANFYASPTGTSSTAAGTGTITNPWNLQTALSGPGVVHPGDTIWLRGGTYLGTFNSYLSGTASQPIVVRQYPGERAIVDGGTAQNNMLTIHGSYTWFWGFELTSSSTDRLSTQATSSPTDVNRPHEGIVNAQQVGAGVGVKIINMVIHNFMEGIALWRDATNVEVYGNLISYNGWNAPNNWGHGIYSQNTAPSTRIIRDNIFYANYGYNIHIYGDSAHLDNHTIDGNIIFWDGAASVPVGNGAAIYMGGGASATGNSLTNNAFYGWPGKGVLNFSGGNSNVTITGNMSGVPGGNRGDVYLQNQTGTVTVTGNKFYGGLFQPSNYATLYPSNSWYKAPGSNPSGSWILVRPNAYEPGRGHVAIFNWGHAASVSVDLSSVLSVGSTYEIRNAQNYFGTPVLTGTYAGGAVSIPMAASSVETPAGAAAPVPTGPEFNAFVVLSGGSGGPPPTPTASNTGPYCSGATISLSTPVVSGGTYSWTGPSGFTSTLRNPTIPNATVANAGVYSVTVTVGGSTSAPGTTTVVVNPVPATPVITAPASALPSTAGLIASVPLHAGNSYLWGITNGTITAGAGTNQITFTAGSSGVTGLTVVETTVATGCASPTATANIYINAQPAGLVEDAHASVGTVSNVNNLLEPGETVLVNPYWKNIGASPLALTGTASAFTGPGGATYSRLGSSAGYGTIAPGATADSYSAGGPSYRFSVSNPVTRPAAHWDATFLETLSNGIAKTWTVHVGQSFSDVPVSSGSYPFIENIFHNGITAGCGGGKYCPASNVTRAQMAVFLATSLLGPGVPVPVSGTVPSVGSYSCTSGGTSLFADVPPTDCTCPSIHYIYAQEVTAGCGGGNYCPAGNVTRDQMAVFLATGMVGPSGTVPTNGTVPSVGSYNCTGGGSSLFSDVPPTDSSCRFIHYIYANDVTAGCGGGKYCPAGNVTRWQMAPFLVTAFHIPFLH